MMTGVLDGGGRAWKVDDSCDGMEEGGRGDRGRVDWKWVRRGLEPRLARLRVVKKMGAFALRWSKGSGRRENGLYVLDVRIIYLRVYDLARY
jgi:hypothetical protein